MNGKQTTKIMPSEKSKTRSRRASGTSGTEAPTARRLLDAAMIEFAKLGYEGARVDKIARRAKVNKQLVYYHFGSKEALNIAVLEEVYRRFLRNDQNWIEVIAGLDAETALRRVAEMLFKPSAELQRIQRIISDANMRGAESLKQLDGVQEAFGRLIDVIGVLLDKGVQEGVFRDDVCPKEFYISMLGALGTRISNAATISKTLDIDLMSEAGVQRSQQYGLDLLFAGIRRAGLPEVRLGCAEANA